MVRQPHEYGVPAHAFSNTIGVTPVINLFRRTFLFGKAALATATNLRRASAQARPQPVDLGAKLTYPFAVPPLHYGYDANEPSIDVHTM